MFWTFTLHRLINVHLSNFDECSEGFGNTINSKGKSNKIKDTSDCNNDFFTTKVIYHTIQINNYQEYINKMRPFIFLIEENSAQYPAMCRTSIILHFFLLYPVVSCKVCKDTYNIWTLPDIVNGASGITSNFAPKQGVPWMWPIYPIWYREKTKSTTNLGGLYEVYAEAWYYSLGITGGKLGAWVGYREVDLEQKLKLHELA